MEHVEVSAVGKCSFCAIFQDGLVGYWKEHDFCVEWSAGEVPFLGSCSEARRKFHLDNLQVSLLME